MDVLLSRTAYDRFSGVLASGLDCTWLCMEQDGTVTSAAHRPSPAASVTVAWASTDVLYWSGSDRFFGLLRDLPRLAWLQSSFAGLDLPVYRPLLERGVVVTTSHANAVSIAENVLGSVLRAHQRPELWSAAQRERQWRHHEFPEIAGSTWMVVGVGAIGSEVASRASAFGARVIGVRRTPTGREPVDRVIRPPELLAALPEADVVVLALPAQRDTRHLVDADFLSRLGERSILVNVARGSLIDEAALLAALDEGRPGLAVLDVFGTEPLPPGSPLWAHPRVVVTPHASSAGLGRHLRNAQLFRRNLEAWTGGRDMENVLTLEHLESAGAGGDIPAQFRT